MFQRAGQQEKRKRFMSEDKNSSRQPSANPQRTPTRARFEAGTYTVQAWRWFGRGRCLAEETRTGFTAPILGLLPGETATVEVESGLLRDALVQAESIDAPSPWRVAPPCSQAAICPGCTMQHVSQPGREDYAATLITEVLQRFGGFDSPPTPRVRMGAAGDHRVRTKVWLRQPATDETRVELREQGDAGMREGPWEAGMRQRGKPQAPLVDFSRCVANAALLREAVGWLKTMPLSDADWARWDGESPSLELELVQPDASPLALHLEADEWEVGDRERLLHYLQDCAAAWGALSVELVPAERPWTHVNPGMQAELYEEVVSAVSLEGKRVFDLTCGDGGLSVELARAGAIVAASDRHWPAVQRCAARAEAEGMPIETRGGDALAVLRGAKKRQEPVDLVVINPMREPVGEATMRAVHESGATELLYLAPAPKAGAKDLGVLGLLGWELKQCVAVDLHPWTGQLMMMAVCALP